MIWCLLLVLALVTAGCGGEGKDRLPGTLVDDFDKKRAEVQLSKDYPLYYLGKSYKDLALTEVLYDTDPWTHVSFIYGTCEPGGDGLIVEGGCAPPYEIQVEPTCLHGVKRLARGLQQRVRGVPAGQFQGWFTLHTGEALIRISGRGRREAAEALRPLGSGRLGDLPPPSRSGTRPCPR